MSNRAAIDAYIAAHMLGASPERVSAMRELLAGRAGGVPLGQAAEWHAALASISEGMALDAEAPRSADDDAIPGLPAARREDELRLVRGWMGVGSRIAGQVFFGA